MPPVPVYSHKLSAAAEVLEQFPAPWVDRAALEKVLGIGRWTAWRLLRRCGAVPGPGKALAMERGELVRRLRELGLGQASQTELARRQRLERMLEEEAQIRRSKQVQIAQGEAAEELISMEAVSLPPGIELSPGMLRMTFESREEFLAQVGALIYALSNDLEGIEKQLLPCKRKVGK
jgi:hypothetical protein